MRIILFDIDGTLISTAGCGIAAMNRAFHEVFGLENALDGVAIAGCTDSSIAVNVLEENSIQWTEERMNAVKELYYSNLQEELENENRSKKLLPGFPCLLSELQACPEFHLGLLTGNWREGAKIKLNYFGLWDYFEFGAFGDDHHDRNELLPFALQRMRRSQNHPTDRHHVFVIGDTPRDVQCGRPYDAVTIAVATGPYSVERLSQEDPHYVLDNLRNVKDFLGIIRGYDRT